MSGIDGGGGGSAGCEWFVWGRSRFFSLPVLLI